jgi:ubiquinone/menaquinone biosynthesis C-methylase UbiE
MAISGNFNTDSKALENRINAHSKFGSKDINDWIFENLEVSEGYSIVDLGCGTGKQTLPMAEAVGDKGKIIAVDISKDSLDVLSKEAKKKSVNERIKLVHCGLDELQNNLDENAYDRILSSFSLYYSKNPKEVFLTIKNSLKKGGIFFFCGPSPENNSELKMFHQKLKEVNNVSKSEGALFMENVGQPLVKDLFGNLSINNFENTLRFDSAEALYTYWSSYNLYDPDIDKKFQTAAIEHFKTNNFFETKKRVIGIKVIK